MYPEPDPQTAPPPDAPAPPEAVMPPDDTLTTTDEYDLSAAPETDDNTPPDPELEALFEQEMLPHYKSLYRFAFKLSSDEDDANDLVQDTFLKAYRFIRGYERGSNAKAWLFRILKNGFINNYRRQSKLPGMVDYEEAEQYLNTGLAAHADTIDARQKMFRGKVGDEVAQALNSLPVDFRIVIILCDIEEFTYEEISKIVDIPIGTVRSRLHRARKMLRDMLLGYAAKLGYNIEEGIGANPDGSNPDYETIL